MATLSAASQIKASALELNSQLMQGTFNTVSKISNQQKQTNTLTSALTSKNGTIYAVKGEAKYKKEVDKNNDGIISFSEYAKYISEQKISSNEALKNLARFTKTEDDETKTTFLTITEIGKAIRGYANSSIKFPEGLIEISV